MWQRFEEKTRQAVFKSQENAMRLRCSTVDSDLLFLGCLDIDQAAVEEVLTPARIDLRALQADIEVRAAARGSRWGQKVFTLSPHGKLAIDYTYDTMEAFGSDTISIHYLVLGIARESNSCLFGALKKRGVTASDLKEVLMVAASSPAPAPSAREDGLAAKLAKMQPLDAVAVMTIREIQLTVSITEAHRLQALLDGMDHLYESMPSRSGTHPIAETMSDAVHLASSRREPLVAAHLLAAMYRRLGTLVNLAAPPHYASPEEMLDRLVPKGG